MASPAELEERLIDFAVRIINIVEALPNSKAGNHAAGQLIRHVHPSYFADQQSTSANHQSVFVSPEDRSRKLAERSKRLGVCRTGVVPGRKCLDG